jgi:hypothetical protein
VLEDAVQNLCKSSTETGFAMCRQSIAVVTAEQDDRTLACDQHVGKRQQRIPMVLHVESCAIDLLEHNSSRCV